MARGRGLSNTTNKIIGKVIMIVVVLAILGATMELIFSSIGDVVGVFTNNASLLNNSIASALAPVFAILIALTGLVGIALFITDRVDFRK